MLDDTATDIVTIVVGCRDESVHDLVVDLLSVLELADYRGRLSFVGCGNEPLGVGWPFSVRLKTPASAGALDLLSAISEAAPGTSFDLAPVS